MDTLILFNEDIFLARGGCEALTLHLYHAGLSPHLLPISHKAYLFKAEARAGERSGIQLWPDSITRNHHERTFLLGSLRLWMHVLRQD